MAKNAFSKTSLSFHSDLWMGKQKGVNQSYLINWPTLAPYDRIWWTALYQQQALGWRKYQSPCETISLEHTARSLNRLLYGTIGQGGWEASSLKTNTAMHTMPHWITFKLFCVSWNIYKKKKTSNMVLPKLLYWLYISFWLFLVSAVIF